MALTHSEHLSTLGGANPRDGGSTTHNHTQSTPLAHSSQHTIAPHIRAIRPPRHPCFTTAHCHPHAPTHPRRAPHTHLRWWVNARTATHTTPLAHSSQHTIAPHILAARPGRRPPTASALTHETCTLPRSTCRHTLAFATNRHTASSSPCLTHAQGQAHHST